MVKEAVPYFLGCLTALVGLTCAADATHIGIIVEQPADAGMPVWLDVRVDEPCIEARCAVAG